MKQSLLLLFAAAVLAVSLISGVLYSSSSPGAKTGSPLDGGTCMQCHQGNDVLNAEDWITTDIPETGWTRSTTYNITVTANHEGAGLMGFELTAENSESKLGTFTVTDADHTKLVNSNKAITHTSNGTLPEDGEISWTFQWTAPETDMGDITFYAAINAANGNGNTSGDQIYKTAISYAQDANNTSVATIRENEMKLFPNPANNFAFVESKSTIHSVSIYNKNGSLIKSFQGNNAEQMRLDLSDLRSDTYIASVVTDKGNHNQHLQIRK